MPARRPARSGSTSEHVLQLFDSRESLVAAVAQFAHEGLTAGERVLLLAKPQNSDSILARLGATASGARAVDAGRVQTVDAAAALAQITSGGEIRPLLFERAVASRVRALAAPGALRVYGEMVDLLVEQDEFDEAIRLEGLWRHLSRHCRFRLLCGCSSAHFAGAGADSMLPRICSLHTAATSHSEDLLAGWLLGAAKG